MQDNINNRKYNCKNPFQGIFRKVLCVCSAGLLRSPTLAEVLRDEFDYNTRACGSSYSHALIPIDPVLIHWADEIVFVSRTNYHDCEYRFPELKNKIVKILSIPDNFEFRDSILKQKLLEDYEIALDINKDEV
ncbi:MAG: hypothetical protein KDB74_01555 [Flavobacteriales bacterium]|nr:hypothetical protein [Flavobacteriales bacterium]